MRLVVLWMILVCLAQAEFRVGVAQVDITPPMGAPMAGYYSNRAASGVHDPLNAKAMVIEQAGTRVAMVACDLLSMPGETAEAARKLISQDPGIPRSHVMISATHTHMGPVLVMGQIRYNLQGEMRRLGEQYTQELPSRIHQAVKLATQRLQAAKLYTARGREDSLTFNRRFWMKDGSVGWNPGKLNPNILRPAGPIDGDVPVLYIENTQGKPIAAYVNYALHLDTVGGQEYTADYPYTLGKVLAEARGEDLLTIFTLGAAGNLNHIDVSTRRPQKGHGEAARIGSVLGASVLQALNSMKPVEEGELIVSTRTIPLAFATFTPEELEKARKDAATFGKPNQAPFLDLVKGSRIVAVAERKGKPIDAEVQVFTIGREIAWVALPGEIFTELGMAIKLASPFHWTSIVSLANTSPGYIPDRKAHEQGAYEAISSRFAPGSGEALVEAASKALVEHIHQWRKKHRP